MVDLVDKMHVSLRDSILVQEQLGFALNRLGRSPEAEKVLQHLLSTRGASSETYGLLGRIFKDRWSKALADDKISLAKGYLNQAIDAYRKGFESDWRDAYPGINCVTLMELQDPPYEDRLKLAPIVRYASEQKIASGNPDYWDHATLLEAAVLDNDKATARDALSNALTLIRESWEPETTINNLKLIRHARSKCGSQEWANDIEAELEKYNEI